jgi:uncharacterized protein (DUF2062 family)
MVPRTIKKILEWVTSLLKKGMSMKKIALCIAMGTALGIFPILGMTTLLCLLAGFVFRLNLPAIQMVNYVVYPLQIILIAPFYAAGGWLFNQQDRLLKGDHLISQFQNDFLGSLSAFWDLTLYAVFTWLIVCPFVILLIYNIAKPVIRRFAGPAVDHSNFSAD